MARDLGQTSRYFRDLHNQIHATQQKAPSRIASAFHVSARFLSVSRGLMAAYVADLGSPRCDVLVIAMIKTHGHNAWIEWMARR
jgi:hypothetical protein